VESVFPASYAQRRLWFIQRMSPSSAAYNMVFSTPLPGEPDRTALQGALNALVERHETLRTSFRVENGQPVQVIAGRGELPLRAFALRERTELAPILSQCAGEAFDLSQAPLARAILASFAALKPVLTLVLHHIIADGQTVRILMEDLEAIYRARVSGQIPVLPELPVAYADYAVWQQRSLKGRRLETLTGYWTHRLQGLPELEMHLDRPRPGNGSVRGSVMPLRIPDETAARLRLLAAGSRTTLFAALLAGFAAVLARFSGQASFAIGVPVSCRTRLELERVAGLFVNSVVFRAEIDRDMSFEDLVKRVGASFAEDLAHQDLPFELVVEALRVKRRADRNPLFQVMFQLQMSAGPAAAGEGEGEEPGLEPDKLTSQLDLSFILYETRAGRIEGGAVYAADLFDPETIAGLIDGYVLLLGEGARRSGQRIGELPILGARERGEVLALGRGEARAWPLDTTLHEWFEERARLSPGSVAVEAEDGSLTFEQLDQRSSLLAADLRELGVRRGSIVAVCLPRSSDLVIAVLGVLKAGAAYLVLDPATPGQRLDFILADCDAAAVVVRKGRAAWASGRRVLELGTLRLASAPEPSAALSPGDPAYVIYTSGSTGQPKGVVIPHGAIVNHMRWMLERFPLGTGDRVLQRTPLTFDASVWELWAPLLAGAVLILAPTDGVFDPARTVELIERERITTLQVVPSLLRALLDQPGIACCTALSRVFCGGEALTAELRDRFLSTLPAELCNLYGPTEATIDATYHVCGREPRGRQVPIGRPIANVVARVLDEHLQPVPCGVAGELFLGGAGLALGYLGRPELTAERLLNDPWEPGGRLFRTGDRVRLLRDGELCFLGRNDHQVKLRGFRIELGEIEAVLLAHPAVTEAAAVVQDHGPGDQRLVAFVAASDPGLSSELLGWLRSRLPAYQVPSAVGVRPTLPKTPHGKIDRGALAQARLAGGNELPKAPPRTAIERHVCGAFAEVLGAGEVGIDDDFFLLGGHSLLVVSVCEELTRRSGIEVGVVDVFEHPTARQLANALAARNARLSAGGT
jgi:amino acid adenylation domain-containing protein